LFDQLIVNDRFRSAAEDDLAGQNLSQIFRGAFPDPHHLSLGIS
jgi:hypothetical protein